MALHKQRPQSSVNEQRQRTRIVRRQSAAVNNPRSRTGHRRNLSATVDRQRLIRVAALSCPHGCRPISRFSSKSFRPMNTFDPAEVRKAVAEFTPRRPQKFQDLVPAKEVIVELRQKGGSYRSIAELLTNTVCRPARRPSPCSVTRFLAKTSGHANGQRGNARQLRCQQMGEQQPRIQRLRANPAHRQNLSPNSDGGETSLTRSRGPRIAQVRKLNPQSNEKTDSHP